MITVFFLGIVHFLVVRYKCFLTKNRGNSLSLLTNGFSLSINEPIRT